MNNFTNSLVPIERKGQRVLLTSQLAEAYETTTDTIKMNFNRNKERYQEGKHYFVLESSALQEFKTEYQFVTQFKHAPKIYLWTEKGALLHAKSLNTDKAWEVYDILVETYFRVVNNQIPFSQPVPVEVQNNNEEEILKLKMKFLEMALPVWEKAGVSSGFQGLAIAEAGKAFDIHMPLIAFKDIITVTYDKTTIARKLGIMSSNGKPHALAIGAIISKLTIEPNEIEQTPFYRNGHDGVEIQYKDTVIDKIQKWLSDNHYPNQIDLPNGKKATVNYIINNSMY